MTNSRSKGKRGELEIVHLLKEHGFEARRGQQFKGTEDSPDIVHDMTGFFIEVKYRENFSLNNIYEALLKADDEKPEETCSVVFYRRNGKPWIAVMDAGEFLTSIGELYSDEV